MPVSWFPGHMHKASKELAKLLRGADVVLELRDARIVASSANPLLDRLRGSLPRIVVLTRADLADRETSRAWQRYFDAQADTACFLSSLEQPPPTQAVVEAAARLSAVPRPDPARKPMLVIVGVPNVGKSTLMNSLLGRALADTGNEPALTRRQQRSPLGNDWLLVDTPGLTWPRITDQDAAYRLALTGAIRNTAIDLEDIAWYAAGILLEGFHANLQRRYGISADLCESEEFLRAVALQRGCIGKGGHVDWHKTAETLLNDFRSGKLGALSLEAPPDPGQN